MSLVKTAKLSQLCLRNHAVVYTAIRNHWNKDFKPAPFPKTQEERAAAAAKYGIALPEYEVYPDDGAGLGDYPKLPVISGDQRDPFYPWDSPELKRNYGEAVDADIDKTGEDRYDVTMRHRIPGWMQWTQFLGVMFGTFALYYYLQRCKMFIGQLPKQYPGDGVTSYTFERKE
ncbi:nadh-ubiquinone oxidoreductase ashi subunit [Holotrichia oblita]|uniref:Nadh-ubiquinone oxidoreductase ashi subunit n=1 Tax=Holotrichia oblita TaxID=644536 RepID=A0ACB9SZ39_HOLOL|nr:nadh-ubiquinone oxidoreductase ashi subunit [Holotrichia oblita]